MNIKPVAGALCVVMLCSWPGFTPVVGAFQNRLCTSEKDKKKFIFLQRILIRMPSAAILSAANAKQNGRQKRQSIDKNPKASEKCLGRIAVLQHH